MRFFSQHMATVGRERKSVKDDVWNFRTESSLTNKQSGLNHLAEQGFIKLKTICMGVHGCAITLSGCKRTSSQGCRNTLYKASMTPSGSLNASTKCVIRHTCIHTSGLNRCGYVAHESSPGGQLTGSSLSSLFKNDG